VSEAPSHEWGELATLVEAIVSTALLEVLGPVEVIHV
jgi:hypothetical protein